MKKISQKITTALAPVPVVMISCEAPGFHPNIITIAWAGTICSDPPMSSVSIRPERYSHEIICRSKEFVVNIPSRELLKATDYCGIVSGREADKFAKMGLTATSGKIVKAPLIMEAPVNIECRVKEIIPLGSHDLFMAEIVYVQVSEHVFEKKERMDLNEIKPFVYGYGGYYAVGEQIGSHGFSNKEI